VGSPEGFGPLARVFRGQSPLKIKGSWKNWDKGKKTMNENIY